MRSFIILLCLGLATALPQPSDNAEDPDIDHMIALLGEGGLLEESSSTSQQLSHVESSESSYFISTGEDEIIEITVAQAGEYGLTCLPAGALSQSAASIIVQKIEDAGAATSATSSGDAAAASAAAGHGAVAVSAVAGGVSSSAAAGGTGGAVATAAAAGNTTSTSAAVGGAGDAAAGAAAGNTTSTSAAAGGTGGTGGAAAAAAAGGTGGAAAAAAAGGTGGVAAAAAAGNGTSTSAAAGGTGDAAVATAAAGNGTSTSAAVGGTEGGAAAAAAAGGSAAASAAAGDSAAASAAAGGGSETGGYQIESGEESTSSEEAEVVTEGACVPYYLCKDGDIVTDGAGLIDMRFGGDGEESKSNSQCPNFLDVFCRVPLSEPDPDILGELTEYEYQPSCGHRNPNGVSIILDGFKEGESQFGEFPWMGIVLEDELLDYDQTIQRYVCGASLIHPQVIMTGAHCINGKDASKLTVRLGDWDTQNEKEIFPHEMHRVASMEVHERFNSANLRYDVGLLFLEKPVVLQQHIDTICLPESDEDFDYASCTATGFGKDQFHGGRFQNIMKQVDLPVVPHKTCQERLRETRLGRWFRLHRTFTCAGGESGVDTCRGDGGSPLVCPSKADPSKYVQVGIVAWGIGCGEDGVPGVYASVPKLVSWVNEKMALHGILAPVEQRPQAAYAARPPV